MKNKDGITYRYTNRMHMNKTKRLKYQRLIKNYKDKKEITTAENKLSEFNSKSCILNEFKKFIKNKNELKKTPTTFLPWHRPSTHCGCGFPVTLACQAHAGCALAACLFQFLKIGDRQTKTPSTAEGVFVLLFKLA
mgnify:CR=1 FL=1